MEEIDSDKQQQDIQELNKRKDEVIEMMIYVNMMNKIFWRFLEKIEHSAKELDIEYSLVDNIAYCRGKAQSLEKFETFLQKIHHSTILAEEKKYDFPQYNSETRRQDWKRQYFVIPLDFTKEDVDVVLYRSRKKELESSYQNNMLTVSGNKFNILKFFECLEDFTKFRRKKKQNFKKFLENLKAQEIKTKIELSSCGQEQNEDILKKAAIIGVECIFQENQALDVSGRADKVRSFNIYIRSVDPIFSKDFYPKYWDFSLQYAYAEIEVKSTSQEFQEIQSLVWRSLKYAALTKLVRIQNQGLMNNYLTMLSSVKNPETRRKRLFYGTEIQEPEKIYKYSKVGFDVSYASFKPNFGKGLHFPITALYCHGYAYQTDPKIFQVLVADVFVGCSLRSTPKKIQNSIGLPAGYDSLLDPGNLFVIYDNSQSYPLYLVEYKLDFSTHNNFAEQKAEEEEKDQSNDPSERPYVDTLKVKNKKPSKLPYDMLEIKNKKEQKNEFECPLELSPSLWDVIKSEVEGLNLEYKILSSTRQVSGKTSKIRDFSEWLNEFLSCVLTDENKLREMIEKKREKIAYSMLYDIELENIMMKASELEVECIFHDNHLNLKGFPSGLEAFKAFLHEVKLLAKNSIFPKYWDFSIVKPYAEIKVDALSAEFKEIAKIFRDGFENAEVLWITRIQNYNLWNDYMNTLRSRSETDVDSHNDLQRKLLFYGTRLSSPHRAFQYSQFGFNIRDANNISKYREGLYFAANSFDSHSLAHNRRTGTFQMLIADVYTSFSSHETLNQAFEGPNNKHDSLFDDQARFFLLNEDSQSYPLYLVDYTLNDNDTIKNCIRKEPVTYVLSEGHYWLLENPDPENLEKDFSHTSQTHQQLDLLRKIRIKKELKELKNDEFIQDHFTLENIGDSDWLEWIVSIVGFKETPYEGGLFKLKVKFPATYPLRPPCVQFLTKIYHPSINDRGMVCLGELSSWSSSSKIRHLLLSISCLLHDPEMEDPLMADIMALYHRDRREYMKTARSWTRKYAGL